VEALLGSGAVQMPRQPVQATRTAHATPAAPRRPAQVVDPLKPRAMPAAWCAMTHRFSSPARKQP
jgi:hypothetical protein